MLGVCEYNHRRPAITIRSAALAMNANQKLLRVGSDPISSFRSGPNRKTVTFVLNVRCAINVPCETDQ